MKKQLLIVLMSSILGFSLDAQVEIRLGNTGAGPDISGTEHVEVVNSNQLVSIVFQIKNISGASHSYTIRRDRLIEIPAWEDYFCWAICYPASSMNSNSWTAPDPLTIGSNGTQLLMADADTHGAGTELYRFYVVNEDNAAIEDSIDVRVTSVLSVTDQEQVAASVSVYPNPVSNVLTVNATGVEGTVELKMVDVLGKVILSESGAPLNKVDVSNFKNGVYLVYVYNKGSLIQTKRIVVKH